MKSFYPFFTIILLLTIGCQAKAETEVSVCEVTIINSPNGRFFLRTIPFDNIIESSDGKTLVFNSDSVLLYEVDRYFEVEKNKCELFLSNDGNTIAYVIDREYEWDTVLNKSIQLYKKGVSFKQFQLNELIDCDENVEDCYLFYKEAIEKIYWENDSLMIKYKKIDSLRKKNFIPGSLFFE